MKRKYKDSIEFFRENLDMYGDFLLSLSNKQNVTPLGQMKIDKFIIKMKKRVHSYLKKQVKPSPSNKDKIEEQKQ